MPRRVIERISNRVTRRYSSTVYVHLKSSPFTIRFRLDFRQMNSSVNTIRLVSLRKTLLLRISPNYQSNTRMQWKNLVPNFDSIIIPIVSINTYDIL